MKALWGAGWMTLPCRQPSQVDDLPGWMTLQVDNSPGWMPLRGGQSSWVDASPGWTILLGGCLSGVDSPRRLCLPASPALGCCHWPLPAPLLVQSTTPAPALAFAAGPTLTPHWRNGDRESTGRPGLGSQPPLLEVT